MTAAETMKTRRRPSRAGREGQVLAGVLILLLIMTILVPLMVFYTQRESVWTAKQSRSTTAFHLSEAGTEKGYLAISLSTQTWKDLQNGAPPTGYMFDTVYSDVSGGTYTISVTSGPGTQQATIISIGRDLLKREVRSLKVVYTNAALGGTAIYAGNGVQIDNGVNVEWGAIVSPQTVDAGSGSGGRLYPQYWSSNSVLGYDTDANPPNCDSPNCCQWHAFQANIPPTPVIDFNFYKSSAQAATGCFAGGTPAGSCYYSGNQTWGNTGTFPGGGTGTWEDTRGKTYYIDGNLHIDPPGLYIVGNLIVQGNLDSSNGNLGRAGATAMKVPQDAWKQYCRDWTHYQTTYDVAAPASFPGLTSPYLSSSTLTFTRDKLGVNGMLYIQGSFQIGGGGGNSAVYGVMYVVGTATMTSSSPVTLYYNKDAAAGVQTTQIYLTRTSWQDQIFGWPAALP